MYHCELKLWDWEHAGRKDANGDMHDLLLHNLDINMLASPVTLDAVSKAPDEGSKASLFSVAWPFIGNPPSAVMLVVAVVESNGEGLSSVTDTCYFQFFIL